MVVRTRITCNFAQSKIIKEKNMRLKKFLSPCAIGIVAVLFTCSCKDEEETGKNREENLDKFVASLQIPQQPEIPSVNTDSFFTEKSASEICTYREYNMGTAFEESFVLDPTVDVIYPGALINGASINTGDYAPVNIARGPITIYTHFMNKDGELTKTIDNPNGATISQAIKELLYDDNINGATEARVNFEVKEIVDKDQLALQLGVSLNAKKVNFTEKFDFNKESNTRNFLIRYIQPMYDISVVSPTRPSDLFAKNVTKEDLETAIAGRSMPCYVGNVTYGRAVYAIMQTENKSSKIENELEASFNALIKGESSSTLDVYKDNSTYSFSGTIIGGNANKAANGIKSIEDIMDFITSEGNFSKDNPAGMLSYKLNKISDNSTYAIKKAANYTIKNCESFNGNIRLESIECRSGEHGADDGLNPYGDVKIHLDGASYTIFTMLRSAESYFENGKTYSVEGKGNNANIGGYSCSTSDGPNLNMDNIGKIHIGINFTDRDAGSSADDPYFTYPGTKSGEESNKLVGNSKSNMSITNNTIQNAIFMLENGKSHEEKFFIDVYRVYDKGKSKTKQFYDSPETLRLHFVITVE